MFGLAISFLLVAIIAGVLGFAGISSFAVEAAQIVFVIALVLFLISALFGVFRGRRNI